jgi:hypothetical protein
VYVDVYKRLLDLIKKKNKLDKTHKNNVSKTNQDSYDWLISIYYDANAVEALFGWFLFAHVIINKLVLASTTDI